MRRLLWIALLGPLLASTARAGTLLPPDQNPAEPPADTVVLTDDLTRRTILMFDDSPSSQRHYDHVECLDGITFAFSHQPQHNMPRYFEDLSRHQGGSTYRTLVDRLVELYLSDAGNDAWGAHRAAAGLPDIPATRENVDAALHRTLLSRAFLLPRYGRHRTSYRPDGVTCASLPKQTTRSFYDDHGRWFIPALKYAFRDAAIVAFQVKDWESRYLVPAREAADRLGVARDPDSILLSFVASNSRQAPTVAAMMKNGAPHSLTLAGKGWRWDGTNRPDAARDLDLAQWRRLLLWQSMCKDRLDASDRLRNRSIAFFREYLSATIRLPGMQSNGKSPTLNDKRNCDPALVSRPSQ